MRVIKAPEVLNITGKSVFLAGSIENGTADKWQERLTDYLKDTDLTIVNPRREDWDWTWEQSKDNPEFYVQVMWELSALERVDKILQYFDPTTKSPISLLELGLYAKSQPDKLIVCCPKGFWRKGNVDIVCHRYGVKQVSTLFDLAKEMITM
jgi:hypothetical protein